MIETWKSFYPGIFSSLYVLCTTLHQRLVGVVLASTKFHRNTPILATSLNCILQLTWVVINDQHNSKLLNQIRSNQSDPYEALLHSASAHGGLPLISGISSSSENIFDKNIDVDSSLRWRVDLAQRIQKHLPLAFRHVWNSISPTFHRYQVLLLESLYRLICASVKFLGASLSAELCLVLVEASYHSLNFHVSDSITKYCLKLRQEIPSSEWIAMQSIFVQVRGNNLLFIGPRDLLKMFKI